MDRNHRLLVSDNGKIYFSRIRYSNSRPVISLNTKNEPREILQQPKEFSFESTLSPNETLVILSFFNGDKYLKEQIDSLDKQTYQSFNLVVSDDGSGHPPTIIESNRKLLIRSDVNTGYAQNFLCTLALVDNAYRFYSFCDQDDVWMPQKLEIAIDRLNREPEDIPTLYCSRVLSVSSNLREHLGLSHSFSKQPSFTNALVQNIAQGNTIVMNKKARDLLVASYEGKVITSHDWWAYLVITGAGGKVIFDNQATLFYRQHGNNAIGTHSTFSGLLKRFARLLEGRFKFWNDINISNLEQIKHLLTAQNQKALTDFIMARQLSLWGRVKYLYTRDIYRQTLIGQIGLSIAILLKKF